METYGQSASSNPPKLVRIRDFQAVKSSLPRKFQRAVSSRRIRREEFG